MDGFVRRPTNRDVGGTASNKPAQAKMPAQSLPRIAVQKAPANSANAPSQPVRMGISRKDIDASLSGIDALETDDLGPKKRRKQKPPQSKGSAKRKWIILVIVLILLAGLGYGGYIAYKAINASTHVFQGSILDVFKNEPLKQDENGRSNILILGTSEDDPGHQGGNLTDSMMIMSIDQSKKNAYMISIPRDLYVKYGQACDSGYQGKINVYYSCVGGDGTSVANDRAALTKTASFVGKIFGLDIQYGVNLNYTVMRQLVKAVGGSITVDIEGDGPTPAGVPAGSIMDSNFDWKCGATYAARLKKCPTRGHFIDYGPGPQVLDAEHALYLAQARGDSAPTWGLAQSNFDREKNQQKIIKALREKAMSTGILANFGQVTGILDALGDNLRTTFETKEVRTLVSLAHDIDSNDINSISLIDGDNAVMSTGDVDGQSVVEPAAGTYDYSQLQSLIQKKLSSNPVAAEAAPIAVFNGSGVAGVAQTEADKLTAAHYIVGAVDNAPDGTYPKYTLYQIGTGNEATAAALKKRYDVPITAGTPPVTVDATTKFVLIVGQQATAASN